ncbi:MAG: hypothetical protein HOE90_05790 [Bacteriovoracaceae bacterium]|nr:hypothetical protein [Bacteriovoracaceae bacterium]
MSSIKDKTQLIAEIKTTIEALGDSSKLIKYYMRHHFTDSFEDIERVFIWHKLNGDIRQGLKTLDVHKFPPGEIDTRYSLGQRAFYAAVLLNFRGAGKSAIKLVENAHVFRPTEFHLLGGIYFLNGYFDKAIGFFYKALGDLSYDSYLKRRICFQNFILSHIYSKQFERADDLIDTLLSFDDEIAQCFACFFRSLNEIFKGNYRAGLDLLDEVAEMKIARSEKISAKSLFLGFKLYAKGKLGIKDDGHETELKHYLEAEFSEIKRNYFKAEGFFFMLDFLMEVTTIDPEVQESMECYPGIDDYIYLLKNSKSKFEIGVASEANISIFFGRSEFVFMGQTSPILTKEIELLGYLKRTGIIGITKIRLFELLWSDDLFGHFFHKDRLKKLIARVNTRFGIKLIQEGEWLCLKPEDAQRIYSNWDPQISTPLFLETMSSFGIDELMSFYDIKKSSAYSLLKEWQDCGLISKSQRGKKTIFHVIREEKLSS